MPAYDFTCQHCGATLELIRPVKEALQPVMCDCGVPMVQQLSASYVQGDLSPYRAVAGDRAGKWITSRKEHREFLKRNRLIEIGNEKPKDTRAMRKIHDDRSRHEIREQMRPVVREAMRNDKRRNF